MSHGEADRMNILHMKYAVEVARIGSINKASEELLVAQPNLSRCIRELEAELGITIFDRSSRGMSLTPEGEDFIRHARKALNYIDEIERTYKGGASAKQRFSISVPRASYISDAFAKFTKCIGDAPAEINYMEANSSKAIRNILNADFRLGIIRYASRYDRYFRDNLEEKGLSYEIVAEFKYVLIMSRECSAARKEKITFDDLSNLIEIVHGDPYVPSLPVEIIKKEEMFRETERRIFLYERGGQFDILVENPETFMWVSPLPGKLLERYGLVQRECEGNTRFYRDVLIHRKDYRLTELDKRFISELNKSKQRWL